MFDLDPDAGLSFADVREAARDIRKLLKTAQLDSFALLTGGKGIHVVVPLDASQGWDEIKSFAKGVRNEAGAERAPALHRHHVEGQAQGPHLHRLAAQRARLDRDCTLLAARATRIASVAVPVSWRELGSIEHANAFTIPDVLARLKQSKADPWKDYFKARQRIGRNALKFFA